MAWRTAGGGAGFIAARAGDGAALDGGGLVVAGRLERGEERLVQREPGEAGGGFHHASISPARAGRQKPFHPTRSIHLIDEPPQHRVIRRAQRARLLEHVHRLRGVLCVELPDVRGLHEQRELLLGRLRRAREARLAAGGALPVAAREEDLREAPQRAFPLHRSLLQPPAPSFCYWRGQPHLLRTQPQESRQPGGLTNVSVKPGQAHPAKPRTREGVARTGVTARDDR